MMVVMPAHSREGGREGGSGAPREQGAALPTLHPHRAKYGERSERVRDARSLRS